MEDLKKPKNLTYFTQSSQSMKICSIHIKGFHSNFEEQQIEYLRNDKDQLSFITALEIELGLNLSEFYS